MQVEEEVGLLRAPTAPSSLVPHPADGLSAQRLQQQTRLQKKREAREQRAAAATAPLSIGPVGRRGGAPGSGRPVRACVRVRVCVFGGKGGAHVHACLCASLCIACCPIAPLCHAAPCRAVPCCVQ